MSSLVQWHICHVASIQNIICEDSRLVADIYYNILFKSNCNNVLIKIVHMAFAEAENDTIEVDLAESVIAAGLSVIMAMCLAGAAVILIPTLALR